MIIDVRALLIVANSCREGGGAETHKQGHPAHFGALGDAQALQEQMCDEGVGGDLHTSATGAIAPEMC